MSGRIPQADPGVFARARRGDVDAHAELYATFAPMVFTLARRMLASRPLAEDVLQETFIEVIRNVRSCRGDGEFGFWVRRIAVNKCLMHLRSGWVSRRVDVECRAATDPGAPAEERLGLERALEALPHTARAVVWLHDVEGYTHREIGRLMGRTASFSKSQLARAHERLKALLGEQQAAPPSAALDAPPRPAPRNEKPQDEDSSAKLCEAVLKTC